MTQAVDIDQDGDLDLLGHEATESLVRTYNLAWVENPAGASFFGTVHRVDDVSTSGAGDAKAVDMDHDGDRDLAVYVYESSIAALPAVVWYENRGAA